MSRASTGLPEPKEAPPWPQMRSEKSRVCSELLRSVQKYLTKMLSIDMTMRPTAAEIIEAHLDGERLKFPFKDSGSWL